MDVLTSEERSALMGRIRGRDTKPEIIVRKFLFSRGFRYRINDPRYPGSPDIVLPKYRTVIFVHGCFWHGHEGCKLFRYPKTNFEFWYEKVQRNRERDDQKIKFLKQQGWNVIVIWECQIKNLSNREDFLDGIQMEIRDIERLSAKSLS
jgi:DNA mismatch endonuclease (patch repair protein)